MENHNRRRVSNDGGIDPEGGRNRVGTRIRVLAVQVAITGLYRQVSVGNCQARLPNQTVSGM